jgi:peptidoglycan/LPS O-acetylase OafA/YrhL
VEQHFSTILNSLTLLPSEQEPILGVAWSLKHEVLFYALFALLFLDTRLGKAVLALWGVLIAGNIATTWITGTPYFTGLAGYLVFRIFNIEFFFGIAVAYLARTRAPWRPRLLLVIGIVLFVGNGLLEDWGPLRPSEWPPRHLAYAAGAALTLYGLAGAERLGRLRVPAPLVALGAASYSMYLLHIIVVMILQQIFRFIRPVVPVPSELVFVCMVGVTIAASLAFCRKVEQPLLRRFRRAPVLRAHAPMPRPPA